MTAPVVFRTADWTQTADGIWEASAPPYRPGDRPPFQAIAWVTRLDAGRPAWIWELYQAKGIGNDNGLDRVATGPAPSLHEAQRLANTTAQTLTYTRTGSPK